MKVSIPEDGGQARPHCKGRWYLFSLWQNHLSTPSFEQVASAATISHISTWKEKKGGREERREGVKEGGRKKGRKESKSSSFTKRT